MELWTRMLSGNFAEMTTSTPFREHLHATNLRHGTDGFTSPPKEGVLRIFSPLKIRQFEPVNLGTKVQHATPRPPKPLLLNYPIELSHEMYSTFLYSLCCIHCCLGCLFIDNLGARTDTQVTFHI